MTTTPSRAVEQWIGATSTNWFDAGNWSAGVPTNSTSTRIDTVTPNATVIGAVGAQATGLRVGVFGTGALTIQSGGTMNNTLGIIADQAGSSGTATVDGAGSTWTNSSDFYVGRSGSGTLTIRNGGAVSNVYGFIGDFSGATGAATVDGAGSTWTNQDLNVGYTGSGTLTIRNGGAVSNVDGYIGVDAGATGAVTVDGTGSTWTNGGDLRVGDAGSGTMAIRNGGVVGNFNGYIGVGSGSTGAVTVDGASSTWTNGGNLYVGYTGNGTMAIRNGGSVSASTVSIASRAGSTGTLNIGAAAGQVAAAPGTLSTASVRFGNGTGQIVFNHTATNYIFAPTITSSGTGAGTVRVEAGTTILTATNTYTGQTMIDGGTLSVSGSIAGSTVTVNAGGALGGNGTVGNTVINGGALAPGNSIGLLTVQGNLSFTAASSYMIEVSPTNTDRVNVTGTATLGTATVNATFAAGTRVAKQYTILNAAGGLGGSTFNALVNTNLPTNFNSGLSYDANNAYLNLTLSFVAPPGGRLGSNQQQVGNALVNSFNSNAGIPLEFGALNGAGLTQASGEIATGSQQTTFEAMTQFLGMITDRFSSGHGDAPGSGASSFADESNAASAYPSTASNRSRAERDAYAMVTKAAPGAPGFDERWSAWAAGFGGPQTTDGNAVTGSNSATSRVYGTAVGADYLFSPSTIAGLALAGGGTNFSVANGGSGHSDLFQAGAFVRHAAGAAYISAAVAYGWQEVTTDRTVTIAGIDRLRARFDANAYSGRIESGYRFAAPWMGITPYAAAQVTVFGRPAYAESVISGANTFALGYGAKTITASGSELGLRGDKSFAVNNAIMTLRGRAAWAHDFNPDRSLAATFQTLPDASFVVNGAAQARDNALVTTAAEAKWLNGFSLAATFDGAFSGVTRGYAGKGIARVIW